MNILTRAIHKFFRPTFITGFDKDYIGIRKGRALLYYKTDAFRFKSLARDYAHTNYWESLEIVHVLNRLGYSVDIIDRTASFAQVQKLEDVYELFIGIGAGDSGQYFVDIAKRVPSAVKVLYALGPEPDISNKITKERYDYFFSRHTGEQFPMRRLIHHIDFKETIEHTDAILNNGNTFVQEGYRQHGRPIYQVYLSSHPMLGLMLPQLKTRDQKKFLYFGGNGNIVKGLDLVIEAFAQTPELELYVGGPRTEEEFNKIYDPIIAKSPNIHILGFVQVAGPVYNNIVAKCSHVILPSSSESAATSVTTAMRSGLIPIVTKSTGLDVDGFGYMLTDIHPDFIRDEVRRIAAVSREEFIQRTIDTYTESFKYTQASFSYSFERAVLAILKDFKKLS